MLVNFSTGIGNVTCGAQVTRVEKVLELLALFSTITATIADNLSWGCFAALAGGQQ